MVVHAYKPSTQEAIQEDLKFEASLGYTVRPWLKTKTTKLLVMGRSLVSMAPNVLYFHQTPLPPPPLLPSFLLWLTAASSLFVFTAAFAPPSRGGSDSEGRHSSIFSAACFGSSGGHRATVGALRFEKPNWGWN
jgi:hypothetical protein